MNKTDKTISKIKVIGDKGIKGLHISYGHPHEKDGMTWHSEHVEKRKHPIHTKLEEHLKELRNFLLDCCGYYHGSISVNEKDYLIAETAVTEIQVFGQDGFKIVGTMRVRGDKYIDLATPKVDSGDEFDDFDGAMLVINKIVEECHEYMAGKVKFDSSQFLRKHAENKHDEVLIQEMASMSNEEKRDRCRDILEKMGAIVIIDEDMDVSDVDVQLNIESPVAVVEAEDNAEQHEQEPVSTKSDPVPAVMPPPEFIEVSSGKKEKESPIKMPAF